MSDDENKEREDEFSTEVNVVLEEEEGLKEEKNDTNRLPNIIVNKEKVFCCLFETLNYKP